MTLRLPFRALLLLLLQLPISLSGIYCQSSFSGFEKFEDSQLRFHAKYLMVKPSTDGAYGGLTLNFSWHSKNTHQWESRFLWEQTLLSDWAGVFFKNLVAGRDITQPVTKSGLDHSFSTGLFGSFQWGANIVATNQLIISACASFGDYIFAVQRFEDPNTLTQEEQQYIAIHNNPLKTYRNPAGYFFVAGPAVVVSYIPVENFWLDVFVAYDFTAYNVGEKNIQNFIQVDDYPDPHFLSLSATINHQKGFFLGTRFYSLINKGNSPTGAYRLDFNLGYNL